MNLQRMKQLAGIKLNEGVMAVPGLENGPNRAMGEGDHDSSFGNPATSCEGKSCEELEAQLAKLKSQFDPGYEFSDDQSYWRRQLSIKKSIEAIEQALGGMNEDESDMQTAETIGQNQDDAEFDMSMGSVTEEVVEDDDSMEECLQNGYGTEKYLKGEDYFPNGADGPVVKATGPSGAKQGDNPEQKKMQVAETHRELVYAYRNFLKESTNLTELKKSTLRSYAKKSRADADKHMWAGDKKAQAGDIEGAKKDFDKTVKRSKNEIKARKKSGDYK